ncbi:hypothetical protein V3C99_013355 [Haemonchus contortus]|uniref:DUF3810 domain-containing protein n=1 Tax=Haemonchus contortus TaxID=6289 RepID=A0A7I4Z5K1_HAECO
MRIYWLIFTIIACLVFGRSFAELKSSYEKRAVREQDRLERQ